MSHETATQVETLTERDLTYHIPHSHKTWDRWMAGKHFPSKESIAQDHPDYLLSVCFFMIRLVLRLYNTLTRRDAEIADLCHVLTTGAPPRCDECESVNITMALDPANGMVYGTCECGYIDDTSKFVAYGNRVALRAREAGGGG